MNFITRNYEFDINDYRAFEIYSDSTCEHLEYTCNYNDMIEIVNDNIRALLEGELIDYQETQLIRNDYIAYNEIVESLENVDY